MKKIAFITTNKSAWGGSEYLWYQTAIRFAVKGNSVIAGMPRWKSLPGEIQHLENNGIDVFFTTDIPELRRFISRFGRVLKRFDNSDYGYRILLKHKPDLVVINQGGNWGGIDLMNFCRTNKLRYVTISHAANEAKWPDDNTSINLAECLHSSAMNYFVSRSNIQLTEYQAACRIENAKVVFNPFNVSYESSIPFPGTDKGYCLANVARHEIYPKGQDILFRVMSDKKWRERDITLRLYGKGVHSGSLKRLKENFRLDNVKMEGHISPEEIWKSNHALILSSRYEGLPLVLVEAMLCARVPVVTSVSGNPEVIEDNLNGFLAESATPHHLDEALERAWQRKDEWETIGQAASKHIRDIVPKDPVSHFYDELEGLLS